MCLYYSHAIWASPATKQFVPRLIPANVENDQSLMVASQALFEINPSFTWTSSVKHWLFLRAKSAYLLSCSLCARLNYTLIQMQTPRWFSSVGWEKHTRFASIFNNISATHNRQIILMFGKKCVYYLAEYHRIIICVIFLMIMAFLVYQRFKLERGAI